MTPLDRQLFFIINNGWKSGLNDLWLAYATWLGNGWIAFPVAIVMLLLIDRHTFWGNIAALAFAGIVGGVVLNLIKNAVHSPRPLTVFASDIAAGRAYVNVLFDRLYWNGFPSGHTQTAFTTATVLVWAMARARKLRWWNAAIVIGIAAVVGTSRIYCGAHFPSDVAAGALLGAVTAVLCCYLVGRWQRRAKVAWNKPEGPSL